MLNSSGPLGLDQLMLLAQLREWPNGSRATCCLFLEKNRKQHFEVFKKIGTAILDVDNNEVY
jgi:hypothetical protein